MSTLSSIRTEERSSLVAFDCVLYLLVDPVHVTAHPSVDARSIRAALNTPADHTNLVAFVWPMKIDQRTSAVSIARQREKD